MHFSGLSLEVACVLFFWQTGIFLELGRFIPVVKDTRFDLLQTDCFESIVA